MLHNRTKGLKTNNLEVRIENLREQMYKKAGVCPLTLQSLGGRASIRAMEEGDYKGGILHKVEQREGGKKHRNYKIPFQGGL